MPILHFNQYVFAVFALAEILPICYHLSKKQGAARTKEKTV